MSAQFQPAPQGPPMVSERLRQYQAAALEAQEKRDAAIARKLHLSHTRRAIDGVFYAVFMIVGMDFALRLLEKQDLIAIIWRVPQYLLAPVGLWWHPTPEFFTVGPLHLYKQHLAALPLYALVYAVLRTVHYHVTVARTVVS